MSASFREQFDRICRASGARRGALARALVETGPTWPEWLQAFNALHMATPELELEVARVVSTEARRRRDTELRARLRLVEARALHRVGSPAEAADVFHDAARRFDAIADPVQSHKARVLRIDALAHAGRVSEAVKSGRGLIESAQARRDAVWRDVLRVNLANALRLGGAIEEAIELYDKAARGAARRGDEQTSAIATLNAGVALMDAGAAVQARDRFASAAASLATSGLDDIAQDARHNEAWAHVRCGDLGRGIRGLGETAERLRERGLVRRGAVCQMDLAEALLLAGDHEEAERTALRAARAFESEGALSERVEALLLAATAGARRRTGAGRRHRAAARRAARGTAREGLALRLDLLQEDDAMRGGLSPDARVLSRLARRAAALGLHTLAGEVELLRAQRALQRGRVADARRHLDAPELRRPGRPWLRAAATTCRAACDARRGDATRALARLRRVCRFHDDVRASLPGAWLRTTFVLDQLDPYLTRVDLLLARGRPADRREAAAVLDALAARRFLDRKGQAGRSTSASLRQRLEALYDQIARGDGPTRGLDPQRLHALESRARRLERAVASHRRQQERTAVERGARPHGRTATSLGPLGADAGALYLWQHAGRLHTMFRVGEDVRHVQAVGSVGEVVRRLERIRFHASRLRHFGDRVDPAGLEAELAALAHTLIEPLDPHDWPARVFLVVDPQCPDIPYECLPIDGAPLSAHRALLRVPGLGVRARRRRPEDELLVVALGESDLPHAAREVRALARADARLEGAGATCDALVDGLTRCRVVHVAGHGFDAPEAPFLGGVRLADGWFSASDVPARVAAELVVLSACRTGRQSGAAAVAWGGLPSALLHAGARRVVWTADDVDDSTTADLMTRFHAALGSTDAATAFGQAMAATQRDRGHAAGLLEFRISGVSS